MSCVSVCDTLSLADLLFGVRGQQTGVSMNSGKRVVTYTVTMALRSYDARSVDGVAITQA